MSAEGLGQRLIASAVRAYPAEYRTEVAPEMLDVVIESGRCNRLPTAAGEAASLFLNGVLLRAKGHYRSTWFLAGAAATIGMTAVLLGVVADASARATVDLYWTLSGSPGSVWIDPFWGTYILWAAACCALLRGSPTLARVTACSAALWSVGAVVTTYWHHTAPDTAGIAALYELPHVVASLAFAVLLSRKSRVLKAHALLSRTSLPWIIALAWVCHLGLSILTKTALPPWWAGSVVGASILVAFIRWGALVRAAYLLGLAFTALPIGRGAELLSGPAGGNLYTQAAVLTVITTLVWGIAYTLIPHLERVAPRADVPVQHSR